METMKKFEKDMAAFSDKEHRLVDTYLTHLFAMGWTINVVKEWVIQHKKDLKIRRENINNNYKEYADKLIKCPECQIFMQLLPVNIDKATQTGDNSKSVWLCQNKNCMHTIYNTETVQEILNKQR